MLARNIQSRRFKPVHQESWRGRDDYILLYHEEMKVKFADLLYVDHVQTNESLLAAGVETQVLFQYTGIVTFSTNDTWRKIATRERDNDSC